MLLLVPFLAGFLAGPAAPAHENLVLAVHPYLPYEEIQSRFTPLAEYLGSVLGQSVVIRVGSDYEEHIAAIARGQVDFAFLGPVGYVTLTRQHGEFPILGRIETSGQPRFRGHIVVRDSSSFRDLKDLAGTRLAFVDPYSTMYLVPLATMRTAGLTADQVSDQTFLGSHHNVVLGILAGDFECGAVKEEVFEAFQDRGLRSLQVTAWIPEHVFVAGAHDHGQIAVSLQDAFLRLAADPDRGTILRAIKSSITGLSSAHDEDYDGLRNLLGILESGDQ